MTAFLDKGKINRPLATLRPMLGCVLGVALLTVVCNAQPTGQSSTGAANQSSDEGKLVCRSEAVTGSRLNKRICKYQREWDAIKQAELRSTEEYTRKTNERSAATVGTEAGGGDPYANNGPSAVRQ